MVVLPRKDRKRNPCTAEDRARNRLIARYRIVLEHEIATLNRFGVVRQRYGGAAAA